MIKLQAKPIISILLLCSVLLSLCGCQQRTGESGKGQAEAAPVKPLNNSGISEELQNDPIILEHARNNQRLSTEREVRSANAFRLFIENTETMAGFVNSDTTTAYQNSLSCLMDVMSSYTDMDAYMLENDPESGQVVWESADIDGHFRSKCQTPGFYEGRKLPVESPLKGLSYLGEEAFPGNALTVLVSNFIEPRYDLNALSNQIETYFDKYANSAACVVAVTSAFKGDFHIASNDVRNTTRILKHFDGETPFYMVIVGPEQDVQTAAENLSKRLGQIDIDCSYCIYTNSMYQQTLLEPLDFNAKSVLTNRKAPADTTESYNTGVLSIHEGGYAYFSGKSDRVETLDEGSDTEISTSTQIALISDGYDGITQYNNFDYELYKLDGQSGEWIPATKLEKIDSVVKLGIEEIEKENPYTGDKQMVPEQLITVKMRYHNASSLSKNQIYRVELRLHLNEESPRFLRVNSLTLSPYSIPRQDYDAALSVYNGYLDWDQQTTFRDSVQSVLLCTPNLSAFLTSLEQLVEKYQDNTEMIEYFDFVFNVPNTQK